MGQTGGEILLDYSALNAGINHLLKLSRNYGASSAQGTRRRGRGLEMEIDLLNKIRIFIANESGAAAIEYGLIATR